MPKLKISKKSIVNFIFLAVCTVLCLVLLYSLSLVFQRAFIYKIKYSEYVEAYSEKYGVDKYLVYSVIYTESKFKENAVSPKNAVGLMQLMPETAKYICGKISEEYDGERLKEPEFNIMLGVYYLSYLQKRFDNVSEALAAYNAGEGRVAEWLRGAEYSEDGKTLKKIPIKETDDYVKKVLRAIDKYERLYGQKLGILALCSGIL